MALSVSLADLSALTHKSQRGNLDWTLLDSRKDLRPQLTPFYLACPPGLGSCRRSWGGARTVVVPPPPKPGRMGPS
jgi:hypothetical protein